MARKNLIAQIFIHTYVAQSIHTATALCTRSTHSVESALCRCFNRSTFTREVVCAQGHRNFQVFRVQHCHYYSVVDVRCYVVKQSLEGMFEEFEDVNRVWMSC